MPWFPPAPVSQTLSFLLVWEPPPSESMGSCQLLPEVSCCHPRHLFYLLKAFQPTHPIKSTPLQMIPFFVVLLLTTLRYENSNIDGNRSVVRVSLNPNVERVFSWGTPPHVDFDASKASVFQLLLNAIHSLLTSVLTQLTYTSRIAWKFPVSTLRKQKLAYKPVFSNPYSCQ